MVTGRRMAVVPPMPRAKVMAATAGARIVAKLAETVAHILDQNLQESRAAYDENMLIGR